MELTQEQQEIISYFLSNPQKPLLVSANAGSGKTFTCKEVLNTYFSTPHLFHPKSTTASGLYLIFNKAMSDFFKRSIKNCEMKNNKFGETLSNIINVKTYHSFLKSGGNLEKMISALFPNKEPKIDWGKGSLNKKDIELICKEITNILYERGVLVYLKDDKTTMSSLISYSRSINEEISKIIKTYFSSAIIFNDDNDKLIKLFKDAEINQNSSKLIPYNNLDRLMRYLDKKNVSFEQFFMGIINDALQIKISEQEISICHDYYYKKIFEMAMNDKEFLFTLFAEYDFLVVDESQDADEMIFELIKRYHKIFNSETNKVKILVVGDTKQNIYQFNGSFNVFDWAKSNPDFFQHKALSQSFRYGQQIADFGKLISDATHKNFRMLGLENIVDNVNPELQSIENLASFIINKFKNEKKFVAKGESKERLAIICRTNNACLNILEKLQDKVAELIEKNNISTNFSKEHIFLDPEIKSGFKDIYKKKITTVIQHKYFLKMLEKALNTYDSSLDIEELTIAEAIRIEACADLFSKHEDYKYLVEYDERFLDKYINIRTKNNAFILITNVHQSKGKEYDTVVLADDFMLRKNEYFYSSEEINIAHTALTRAKKEILFLDSDTGKNNMLCYFFNKKESPTENSKIDAKFLAEQKTIKQELKNNICNIFELDNEIQENTRKIKI